VPCRYRLRIAGSPGMLHRSESVCMGVLGGTSVGAVESSRPTGPQINLLKM
jgi:hypothetical protein